MYYYAHEVNGKPNEKLTIKKNSVHTRAGRIFLKIFFVLFGWKSEFFMAENRFTEEEIIYFYFLCDFDAANAKK